MQVLGEVHINVDVMYVVTLIFGHLKRILALRDEFVAKLKDFDISSLRSVRAVKSSRPRSRRG